MSFLGEVEDVFDVELEEEEALKIYTVGEALELLESMTE
jgi:acyl carrier protein